MADDEHTLSRPEESEKHASPPRVRLGQAESDPPISGLAATIRNQDDIEADIAREADNALYTQAQERDKKRLHKSRDTVENLQKQSDRLQERIQRSTSATDRSRSQRELDHLKPLLQDARKDVQSIEARMAGRMKEYESAREEGTQAQNAKGSRHAGETRRERLIRTGKITPFAPGGREVVSQNLMDVMYDAEGWEEEDAAVDDAELEEADEGLKKPTHRNLRTPGFEAESNNVSDAEKQMASGDAPLSSSSRPSKRRRIAKQRDTASSDELSSPPASNASEDEFIPEGGDKAVFKETETDEEEMGTVAQTADYESRPSKKKQARGKRKAKGEDNADSLANLADLDDGNEEVYQTRLQKWTRERRAAREKAREKGEAVEEDGLAQDDDADESTMPHPTRADTVLPGGLRLPGDIYPSLFDYQKTGVRWLWELFQQQVGGLIGDEMGLGKTIQVISFLAGLHHSQKLEKPVIVVCPATVLQQWSNEFHKWWPPLRVSILHSSGSGILDVRKEAEDEEEQEIAEYSSRRNRPVNKSAKKVVDRVLSQGHVLVTTYSGLQTYCDLLLPVTWSYAVLDEGHKIRNPNTAITIYCKELKTPNRLILSGTPMQNNLQELWSLFDFVFPMRLGNLVNFRQYFEIPIKQGGYANASNLQVETAHRCAQALKDAISPYLLQRFKVDVASDLPKKSEQVLFCHLTKYQRQAYEAFLSSDDTTAILAGKRQALYGIDILRKICNHPDLQEHKHQATVVNYGDPTKSGKMGVVKDLILHWKTGGHKTLLFAQHRIMLDILDTFVRRLPGVKYRRMDGNTSIKERQSLVDEFNNDPSLDVFLLTTKVGGLGVNLVGADRVIIYDPDWNPSTDVQARERAWRLGQQREVQIYRLMTAGTIEEKIYHRQLFKQFLSNKILRDPKQRQTFQLKDLTDLFTLGSERTDTETSDLFKGAEVADPDNPTPADEAAITEFKGISHRNIFAAPERSTPHAEQEKPQPSAAPSDSAEPVASSSTAAPLNGTNDRLMSVLFGRAGVHSALSHDAIMNGPRAAPGSGQLSADPETIAAEARRVAREAARQLSRSEDLARQTPIGVPTWTGSYGAAGRPASPAAASSRGAHASALRRGGRGSSAGAATLNQLSHRQNEATAPAEDARSWRPGYRPSGQEFMKMIQAYLKAQPGCATYTQMLVDHFNPYCSTEQATAEFKEMLRVIARLEKPAETATAARRRGGLGQGGRMQSRGGRAKWILRSEFGGPKEEDGA